MTTLVAGSILVVALATLISLPLFRPAMGSALPSVHSDEALQREKSIALLAIKEAQFDHATGKLTDADYSLLRSEYEERALHAIRGLESGGAVRKACDSDGIAVRANFCHHCGRQFDTDDRFCASCGTARLDFETSADS